MAFFQVLILIYSCSMTFSVPFLDLFNTFSIVIIMATANINWVLNRPTCAKCLLHGIIYLKMLLC